MQVTLKLYASLGRFLPDGATRNAIRIDVAEGTTITALLDAHNVPREACHLVLLNGLFQPQDTRETTPLQPNDELAVWPPVAGG